MFVLRPIQLRLWLLCLLLANTVLVGRRRSYSIDNLSATQVKLFWENGRGRQAAAGAAMRRLAALAQLSIPDTDRGPTEDRKKTRGAQLSMPDVSPPGRSPAGLSPTGLSPDSLSSASRPPPGLSPTNISHAGLSPTGISSLGISIPGRPRLGASDVASKVAYADAYDKTSAARYGLGTARPASLYYNIFLLDRAKRKTAPLCSFVRSGETLAG